ncbi:hypothetical protein NDU88_005627 [Pleurodeles waltl]|uniref:Uncharacterized protein n=1 Tax=Pleurodeles waltl TaxID=8319 RepID=A0AAV7QIE4_PLEWA|nr:hypothetical protein NDU88_005627 [Pleurodeles waltl]
MAEAYRVLQLEEPSESAQQAVSQEHKTRKRSRWRVGAALPSDWRPDPDTMATEHHPVPESLSGETDKPDPD